MRINTFLNCPSFKANFYKINTSQRGYIFFQTDSEKKLGNEPALYYRKKDGQYGEISPLEKDENGLFTAQNIITADKIFQIKFKDTQNSEEPFYISNEIIRKALIYDKKAHKQPLIHFLSENETNGKLLILNEKNRKNKIEDANSPIIIMCKTSEDLYYYTSINKPPAGVIFIDTEISDLSHEAAFIRNMSPFAVGLWDENKINELKQYENEYIKITPNQNDFEILLIEESELKPVDKAKKQINIPKLKPVDKLLSTKEYTKDNVGNKAYNLSRLEKMVDEGKLDVIIPKSFAIPYKYIEGLIDENELSKSEDISPRLEEIKNKIKETKIDGLYIVRSAFNGEDLDDYAAQGLYDSVLCREGREYESIMDVVKSKNTYRAVKSRKEHGIKEEDIKPTVIIHDRIPAEYTFTIYTKNKDNDVLIELSPKKNPYREAINEPYTIKYNPDKDSISIESIARQGRFITMDENENIIDEEPITDEISKNLDKYEPILKAAARNALKVEKEFGRPQDIEGGILGEQIYFWQTRNIVRDYNEL